MTKGGSFERAVRRDAYHAAWGCWRAVAGGGPRDGSIAERVVGR